ncbi:MAG: MAPEG family protein [Pseudomonadota bacterium]
MTAILPPLFIQIGLTFVVCFLMAGFRVMESVRDPKVSTAVQQGRSDVYGRTATLLSDNLKNQFEFPILFYAAVLLAVATGSVSDHLVTLAWVFALARVGHALVHCTLNIVALRFVVFGVSLFALLFMWLHLFQTTLGA